MTEKPRSIRFPLFAFVLVVVKGPAAMASEEKWRYEALHWAIEAHASTMTPIL